MATENYQETSKLNFLADAAITKRGGVKITGARRISKNSVAGERSLGAAECTVTAAGDDIGVIPGPCFKIVTSGAAIGSANAELAMDADGKYRIATAGQVVVGYSTEITNGADVDFLAFLLPPSQYRVPSPHITDASTAHALNATFSDTEVEAALNAIGWIINTILLRLEAHGINLTS